MLRWVKVILLFFKFSKSYKLAGSIPEPQLQRKQDLIIQYLIYDDGPQWLTTPSNNIVGRRLIRDGEIEQVELLVKIKSITDRIGLEFFFVSSTDRVLWVDEILAISA